MRTDIALPMRPKLRMLRALPRCRKSSTEQELPTRPRPARLREEPAPRPGRGVREAQHNTRKRITKPNQVLWRQGRPRVYRTRPLLKAFL